MKPVIKYFITRNRITPFAALYGHWQRGNFKKACNAGVCIWVRDATELEISVYENNMKELGFGFKNITAMVREVSIIEGPWARKMFMKSLRYHRHQVMDCLKDVKKKTIKHQEKKERNRQIRLEVNKLKTKKR